MKYDKKTLIAAILFAALFTWLVILSLQQQSLRNLINQPLKRIQGQLTELKNSDIKTINIKGTTCSVTSLNQGAQLKCSDGTVATISNGTTLPPAAPLPAIPPQKGDKGDKADPTPTNYDLWLQAGNTGTITDYLNTLKGQDGANGNSVQMRCNPTKLQIEYRYVGDTIVHPLNTLAAGELCAPGSTVWQP